MRRNKIRTRRPRTKKVDLNQQEQQLPIKRLEVKQKNKKLALSKDFEEGLFCCNIF